MLVVSCLIILRVASLLVGPRGARRTEWARRSCCCAVTSTTQHSNGCLIVASLLEVLLAAPRGGVAAQQEHLGEGRELLLPRSISPVAASIISPVAAAAAP